MTKGIGVDILKISNIASSISNPEDSFISQDQLQQLTQLIFARKRAKVCITGYVDFLQGKYLSTLSLVKRKN